MTAANPQSADDCKGWHARWLTTGRFAAILGLLVFAAFPEVLVGSKSFIFRDFGLFGYPLAEYHRDSFWRGEVPLWNPYNNFGIPFLAQWGTMVLYPPSLIYILLPLPWSLGLFCLVHLWLGGVGMFVLARQWTGSPLAAALAAIAFAFSGFVLNCLMWPNYSASLAWMPWVVWSSREAWSGRPRFIAYASLIGALQMFSGTPEVILFTWLLVAGLWCCDHFSSKAVFKSGLRLSLVVLLVAMLSAAQLLPFLELLAQSERDSSFAGSGESLPLFGFANLLVPLFRTHTGLAGVHFQESQSLTSSYYPGAAAVLLSLFAIAWVRDRRVWFLAGSLVLSFVIGLGEQGILYRWIREWLPWVGFMRYPAKLIIVCTFIWPLLAAFGLTAIFARPDLWRRLAMICAALLALIVAIVAAAKLFPFPEEQWTVTLRSGVERGGFLIAITSGLIWFAKSRRPIAFAVIAVAMWIDLFIHLPAQNPTAPPDVFTAKLPHLEQMNPRPRVGESRALLTLAAIDRFRRPGSHVAETYLVHRSGLFDNCNLMDRIPKVDGFYALYLQHERDVHFRLFESDDRPRAPLARFVGISQMSGRSNVLAWQALTNFMPFVTAGQQPRFATDEQTLAGLIDPRFSPEAMVFLPDSARSHIRATNGAARVISWRVQPHRIEAEVDATAPSLVMFAQAHYPAWRAMVDGRPAAIWRANHAFQAVQVEAGRHKVELIYSDARFAWGAVVSAGSVFLIGAGLAASRFGTRRASLRDTAEAAIDGEQAENRAISPKNPVAAPLRPLGTAVAKGGSCGR